MGIGAAILMTYWRLVLLLADWISRREDTVVYRAGRSNQAGSLALVPWDKSNNFAHICSKHWLEREATTTRLGILMLAVHYSPKSGCDVAH